MQLFIVLVPNTNLLRKYYTFYLICSIFIKLSKNEAIFVFSQLVVDRWCSRKLSRMCCNLCGWCRYNRRFFGLLYRLINDQKRQLIVILGDILTIGEGGNHCYSEIARVTAENGSNAYLISRKSFDLTTDYHFQRFEKSKI